MLGGAADAGEGRRARREPLGADRAAAYIAYFVYARVEFPQRLVDRGQAGARLGKQRRDMLALERDRGTLGVVLVVAARRAAGNAGDDRGELPLKLGDLLQGLIAIGIQPRLCIFRLSHLRHLPLGMTIRSVGSKLARLVRHCEGS